MKMEIESKASSEIQQQVGDRPVSCGISRMAQGCTEVVNIARENIPPEISDAMSQLRKNILISTKINEKSNKFIIKGK